MASYVAGKSITLEKNPGLHVRAEQADQAAKVPSLQVVSGETMRIAFMQLNSLDNTPTPALKDARVRNAITHAIDRCLGRGRAPLRTAHAGHHLRHPLQHFVCG
ncbi:MAG: hypothetical protein ACM3SO_02660 [Betaproteobacteria bacterium]